MFRMTRDRHWLLSMASLVLLLTVLFGCGQQSDTLFGESTPSIEETLPEIASETETSAPIDSDIELPVETLPPDAPHLTTLRIENCDRMTLAVGDSITLVTNVDPTYAYLLTWTTSNDSASVMPDGTVTAMDTGKVTVTVTYGHLYARALIEIIDTPGTETDASETDSATRPIDPNQALIPEVLGSPVGYRPAGSYEEALERTERGELSGYLYVPDQAPHISPDRPMENGQYIRNSEAYFADENTYVVVNAHGDEVFRIYRGGGYITLEEVAAYLYAFGDVPANYNAGKKLSPTSSIWGEYLRLNHSKFSGNTNKYPYEPVLPRINGCGGDLQYYEIDIGTTGTDCDPGYSVRPYNNGVTITRGAARIVYSRFDANGNQVIEPEEKFIFYTYNHYNDFQEYLNYYNGWGEMFGNITGGGTLSSKYDYSPTPYVSVILAPLPEKSRGVPRCATVLACLPVGCDNRFNRFDHLTGLVA